MTHLPVFTFAAVAALLTCVQASRGDEPALATPPADA